MFHKIYPKPFTRINEAWNASGLYQSHETDAYCDPLITGKANGHLQGSPETEFYKKIAIDIVTETAYNYPVPFLSEKFMRPILYKRMFILVAPMGQLQLLKNFGYKTFSPFINEDYDTINDPHERMQALCDEIERLCSLPLNKLQETTEQFKEVLTHNYNHLKSQKDRDISRVKKLLGISNVI